MKLKRWGFTNIEIIMVVAVLAIIGAIVIPNMVKARTVAIEDNCRTTARLLQSTLNAEAASSDNFVSTANLSENQIITLVQSSYNQSTPHCSCGHYYTDEEGNVMCSHHNSSTTIGAGIAGLRGPTGGAAYIEMGE